MAHVSSKANLLPQILSTSATKWAVGGWSFFIAENVILSENRTFLISEFGESNYRLAYGSCSTIAMVSILYGYFAKVKREGPFRTISSPKNNPKLWMGSFIVQGFGAVLVSQMLPKCQIPLHLDSTNSTGDGTTTVGSSSDIKMTSLSERKEWKVRCPFDFSEGRSTSNPNSEYHLSYIPHGVERITRHPGLWSLGFLGFGNAMITPSIPRAIWLSMPVLVALIGGAHQDSRHARGIVSNENNDTTIDAKDKNHTNDKHQEEQTTKFIHEKLEKTSLIPFWAIICGKQGDDSLKQFALEEIKGLNAALALGIVGIFVLRRGRGIQNADVSKLKFS